MKQIKTMEQSRLYRHLFNQIWNTEVLKSNYKLKVTYKNGLSFKYYALVTSISTPGLFADGKPQKQGVESLSRHNLIKKVGLKQGIKGCDNE